ncbi:MAG: hypothetical protein JO213_00340 [Alphaproteobacteria bacterium]|nr:hypothetical protein [Alphaproteobacteria bacterium]
MKRGIVGLAGVLLAGMAWVQPAAAQNVPPGSYLQSCFRPFMEGDRLVAVCRRGDGRDQRTSLPDVRRCVGDIGNNKGNLQCSYAGGPGGPPPGYGERRYGEDRRERCFALHRESEELHERMEREFNPSERMRLDGRLHEVREQEERMDCRR